MYVCEGKNSKIKTLHIVHIAQLYVDKAKIDKELLTCLYIYIHTYTCIHTYMHNYIHAHIHTYMHTYIHTRIHTYRLTDRHPCIHTYIHACIQTVPELERKVLGESSHAASISEPATSNPKS